MSVDLFISHCTADAETARVLVTDFENRGITCWVAPRDIPMGSSYQNEIVAAIERCRAMLLLFSDAANNSEHVLREVELAAQGRKPILPLRIDASEPAGGLRYMLANKQWVERKALGNRLVDTIEQLLANTGGVRPSTPQAPPPVAVQPRSNRAMMIGGAALALVLLGGGAFALLGGWPPKPAPQIAQNPPLAKAATPVAETPPSQVAAAPAAPAPAPSAAPQVPPAAPASAPPAPAASPPVAAPAPAAQPPVAAPSQPPAAAPSQPPAATPAQPAAEPPVREARRPDNPPVAPPVAATPEISGSAPSLMEAVPGKDYFRECDMCPVMVVVPAGSNRMGSPGGEGGRNESEGPQQDIVIRQPFAVGRSEISFEQWLACVAEGGCNAHRPGDFDWGYGKRPAINVSWNDAKAYVEWLSQKTKATYRLLSEAEWEYVARGCAKVCESTPFWFGSEISKARANYDWRYAYEGSQKAVPPLRTVPVDAGEPNPFGLLHVHGNVREWVEDCWNTSLLGIARDGSPRTTGDCRSRVVRGGSWYDQPKDLRSAKRSWEVVGERRAQIGFRVARVLAR